MFKILLLHNFSFAETRKHLLNFIHAVLRKMKIRQSTRKFNLYKRQCNRFILDKNMAFRE